MMQSDTTPHPRFIDKTLKCNIPYLQIYVTLLVMPEGVRVEKGHVVEGAHQPHTQVYLAHMCTNGGMRLMGPPSNPQPDICIPS